MGMDMGIKMDMGMKHDRDMHHGHGHEAWIGTCTMDMGMEKYRTMDAGMPMKSLVWHR
jgi:hypothetical protein